MLEVILDTETTGLLVKDKHRIVEIGCIELDNLIPTSKKFHCYLNPERKVSEQALKVHGYTDDFLSSQKKFKDKTGIDSTFLIEPHIDLLRHVIDIHVELGKINGFSDVAKEAELLQKKYSIYL